MTGTSSHNWLLVYFLNRQRVSNWLEGPKYQTSCMRKSDQICLRGWQPCSLAGHNYHAPCRAAMCAKCTYPHMHTQCVHFECCLNLRLQLLFSTMYKCNRSGVNFLTKSNISNGRNASNLPDIFPHIFYYSQILVSFMGVCNRQMFFYALNTDHFTRLANLYNITTTIKTFCKLLIVNIRIR